MSAAYHFKNSARFRSACEQGSTFRRRLTLKDSDGAPVDLSGYTVRMQVRSKPESPSLIVSLTTENGRITVDGPGGTITLHLSAEETDDLPAGGHVYDLELVNSGGDVLRLLEGHFLVTGNVTR